MSLHLALSADEGIVEYSTEKAITRFNMHKVIFVGLAIVLALSIAGEISAGTIIEYWEKVKAPKAPKLEAVSVSAKDSALISMDLQSTSCVLKRRPRCVETINPIKDLLARARAKGMLVVHTFTSSAAVDKILPELAPKPGELAFSSTVNSFTAPILTKCSKTGASRM